MFVWETLFYFILFIFFHAQIESMLTYTAEVWGLEDVARIGKTKKQKSANVCDQTISECPFTLFKYNYLRTNWRVSVIYLDIHEMYQVLVKTNQISNHENL